MQLRMSVSLGGLRQCDHRAVEFQAFISITKKVLEQNKKQLEDIVRSVDRECYYNTEELMGSECKEIHPVLSSMIVNVALHAAYM